MNISGQFYKLTNNLINFRYLMIQGLFLIKDPQYFSTYLRRPPK